MNFKLGLILLLIILSACGTQTILNDFVSLNKELDYKEAKVVYEDHFDFEDDLIEIDNSGKNYKLIYLPIITDLTRTEETRKEYNPNHNSSPGSIHSGTSGNMYEDRTVEKRKFGQADFYILFENDKYLMSGFEYQIELLGNDKIVDVFAKLKEIKED